VYRESPAAVHNRDLDERRNLFAVLCGSCFLLLYFTLLPVLLHWGINWLVYFLTVNNFYQEPWMMPTLMLLSTFLAGALMRQKMEDESGGMGLFFLGVLALAIFAWMTHQDIATTGGVYSRLLPKLLRASIDDYVYMLPAVGMIGMLCYKQFTLKHYN
jgi:uncharacterized membrane protein (DUF485 family)